MTSFFFVTLAVFEPDDMDPSSFIRHLSARNWISQ
jgi:hypothetical protein